MQVAKYSPMFYKNNDILVIKDTMATVATESLLRSQEGFLEDQSGRLTKGN